jgi:hypothetical protein
LEVYSPSETYSHTTAPKYSILGRTETGATVEIYVGSIKRVPAMTDTGIFSADVWLLPGENDVKVVATDAAGHTAEILRAITYDIASIEDIPNGNAFPANPSEGDLFYRTDEGTMYQWDGSQWVNLGDFQIVSPKISSLVIDTSSTTRNTVVKMSGKVNKEGRVTVNGAATLLMSDGTFEHVAILSEGMNSFEFVFEDAAGNSHTAWRNVTRDTVAPELHISEAQGRSSNGTYTVSGTTDVGSVVAVNGKPITPNGSGGFSKNVDLSHGINTVVVTSKDSAGNVAEHRITVSYVPEPGTNWGAIGLMIGLLVVGLVVGILVWMMLGPKGEPKEPKPEEPKSAEEAVPEEPKPVEDEPQGLELEGYQRPTNQAGPELLPMEPAQEAPAAEELTVPAEEPKDLPPIPAEEAIPEELPPVEPAAPAAPEADPVAAEKIAKLDKALADGKITKELYDKNVARIRGSPAPEAAAPQAAAEMDPVTAEKIAKLDKALADGKISKELYDKNVARIRGQ